MYFRDRCRNTHYVLIIYIISQSGIYAISYETFEKSFKVGVRLGFMTKMSLEYMPRMCLTQVQAQAPCRALSIVDFSFGDPEDLSTTGMTQLSFALQGLSSINSQVLSLNQQTGW